MTAARGAALAIDAAEWFHDPALAGHVSVRHWRRFAPRAELALRAMRDALAGVAAIDAATATGAAAANGARATWFVTGELATRAPDLLRELVADGHELGLAALAPKPLDELDAHERGRVAMEWLRALAAIEAASGRAVVGFRAVWPVGDGEPWWHAWLDAHGLRYDATERRGAAPATAALLATEDAPTGAAAAPRAPTGAAADPRAPTPFGAADMRSPTPFAAADPRAPTPFAAGGSLRTLRSIPVHVVPAWVLDAEQPRLVGLAREAFAAHYDRLPGGAAALAAAARAADGPIAAARELSPAGAAAPRALPASAPAPVVRAGAPRFAIVVPLKDEETGIASLAVELENVARHLADVAACEFVFVDDGSTDGTWALLQQHFGAHRRARLVRHERNRGVAAAIRSGIAATDAALVASIDGDLSYDPMELRAMLALATDGGADVVTASPYHPRGGVRNVPGWRLLLSRTLSLVYRVLLRSPVHTWTACFRVYRRATVAGLPLANEGFLGTAELLVRVLRRGGRVAEHPCVLEARLFGFSKMRVARTILGHLRLLGRVALGAIR